MRIKKNLLSIFILLQSINVNIFTLNQQNIQNELKECSKIVMMSLSGLITYGVCTNLIMTVVCPGYFTEGLRREKMDSWEGILARIKNAMIPTKNLAPIWGVLTKWKEGLLSGIILALCARFGKLNKLNVEELIKPLIITLTTTGIIACILGAIGYFKVKDMEIKAIKYELLNPRDIGNIPDSDVKSWVANDYASKADEFGLIVAIFGLTLHILRMRLQNS